jgi:hypothetical protein
VPPDRRVATPHAMDDFTIILPALPDITSCDLKAYDGLYRLWRMVERYKMETPITITVVDNAARQVRAIRGDRIQAGAWRLQDTPTATTPPIEGEFRFPLTMHVQDAKGNILKMKLQLEVAKPEIGQKKGDAH